MTASPFAALVDWGTSNLRIWLVDSQGAVLGERQSPEGMGGLDKAAYPAVLEGHLSALGAPSDLPVVVAGMAGARTGWREAPYVETPAPLVGLFQHAVQPEGVSRPVYILPGVCQREGGAYDVMRGEETQLAGALEQGLDNALFCLPGTHSKWALVEDGQARRFSTVMTGELFNLISRQSILRLSVPEDGDAEADPEIFDAAVAQALEPGFALTSVLFSIRAEGLLAPDAKINPAARLSGLLIGAEIAAIRDDLQRHGKAYLIGTGKLTRLYARAITKAGGEPVMLDGGLLVRRGLLASALSLFDHEFKD
ncbi:2-dehydro-3-deoxygalactonokinase [Rhizobium rosettiformans]|uniref:2-dehydro-3-deoxygalactonokinase n=2 Tax=Rhizobium rosettiformans TaxID=1368430 RepID=A0A4S8PZW3_9HYPH|nr:2-dehydro-3-deoxygalactonokinase [Rhizobium rosettiformans]MBB5275501.1 2-dehydro-3-deoxygalactonokinase [Rhizobium rosettiformans]THV37258.1 2-dehydro-3-deoxygalactonokinase [Rhizobium rosettiformans W3]